jgi:uncharacterized phage protein (TIGR02216 family)
MTGGEGFPWRRAMAIGFGRLRLSSAEFWAMTPRELAAAVEGLNGTGTTGPPARADLETLIARYPDEEAWQRKSTP